MKRRKLNKPVSLFIILLIYALAFMVGFWAALELKIRSPLWQMVYAGLVAAVVIYFFSKFMDNSSVFDPYWSVAPVLISFYWLLPGIFMGTVSVFQWTGLALVIIWGLRLTLNWMLRWKGMEEEDWRYVAIREKTKHWYWPVSLVVIHLLPAIVILLAVLPLYFVFGRQPGTPVIGLWLSAVIVMMVGIGLEATADFQLLKFRGKPENKNQRLRTGLWKKMRHPNYTGEILFWWGVYLYSISFYPALWRLFLGPGLVTLLIIFVSIPWMDKHLENKK